MLVELYFRNYETCYRILHIPSFYKEYQQMLQHPENASGIFIATVLSVISIGCSLHPTNLPDGSSPAELAHKLVGLVESWMANRGRKPRQVFPMLQIQCLLAISQKANATPGSVPWVTTGILLRSAFSAGLHRDNSTFSKCTPFIGELRRRLWWTCLELDLQISVEQGMESSTRTESFDCEPPLNVDDEQLHPEMLELPPPKPFTTLTRTWFQIMLSESVPVRLEISRTVNQVTWSASFEDILRLEDRLTDIISRDHDSLCGARGAGNYMPSPFQQEQFELLNCRWILLVNLPLAGRALRDARLQYSHDQCLRIANRVHDNIKNMARNYPGQSSCLATLGGGVFVEDLAHTCHLFCSKVIQEAQAARRSIFTTNKDPHPLLEKVEDILRFLRDSNGRWKTATAVHVWLSMVLGYVRAKDAGSEDIAGGIREGLRAALQYYATNRPDAAAPGLSSTHPALHQQQQQAFPSPSPSGTRSQPAAVDDSRAPGAFPYHTNLPSSIRPDIFDSFNANFPGGYLLDDADIPQILAQISNEDMFSPWFDSWMDMPHVS